MAAPDQVRAGMGNPSESFGDLLRRHRVAAGLTQEALAERAGLSRRGIADLERGVRRTPYRHTVTQLADALGLDAAQRGELARASRGARARSAARLPTASSPVGGWSAPLSVFVGRRGELTKIEHLLTRARLLTLVGPGGVGKTRLALQLAEEAYLRGVDEARAELGDASYEKAEAAGADMALSTAVAEALGVVETRPLHTMRK
jgi:transcriptional regulator with XRE-family HTH domain